MPTAQVEQELGAEPAVVFEWLTDPVLLARWWPSEAETDPTVGGRYRMYWAGPEVTLRGEYRAVDAGERLAFSWSWDHDDLPPRDVVITLRGSDRGTKVDVAHEAGSEAEATDYVDGWTHFLGQLDAELSAG